jgi:transcriptional regulator of acetoin/glycerol metabolism
VRASALCDGTIRVQDLPDRVRNHRETLALGEPEEISGGLPGSWPTLSNVEGRYVERVLAHTAGNKQAAARLLSVDRKTLERMIKRHHISLPRIPATRQRAS